MKFIHFTDTHLVDPAGGLHGMNPEARFKSCIESIEQSHSDAECCVVTGDIADRAEDRAYELFAQQIRRFDFPCHLLIGNHDNRQAFTQYFPQVPVDRDGFIQYVVKTSAGVFVMLDTVVTGSSGGAYVETRRAWLRGTLAAHANGPVYLFIHPPPCDLFLPSIDPMGLAEKQAFAEIVSPEKNIRHL